jgi:hypothetical protein
LRIVLLSGLPVAIAVTFALTESDATRTLNTAIGLGAWITVAAGSLRNRAAVGAVACVGGAMTLVWAFFAGIAAEPCGLHGGGILTRTPRCPVQAIHLASAIIGGTGCLALAGGAVAAALYAARGDERAHRLFRRAFLLAALLMITWALALLILPAPVAGD